MHIHVPFFEFVVRASDMMTVKKSMRTTDNTQTRDDLLPAPEMVRDEKRVTVDIGVKPPRLVA